MFGLLVGKRDRYRGWTPAPGSDRRVKGFGLPTEVSAMRESEMGRRDGGGLSQAEPAGVGSTREMAGANLFGRSQGRGAEALSCRPDRVADPARPTGRPHDKGASGWRASGPGVPARLLP